VCVRKKKKKRERERKRGDLPVRIRPTRWQAHIGVAIAVNNASHAAHVGRKVTRRVACEAQRRKTKRLTIEKKKKLRKF
jgi:hypothetical protein